MDEKEGVGVGEDVAEGKIEKEYSIEKKEAGRNGYKREDESKWRLKMIEKSLMECWPLSWPLVDSKLRASAWKGRERGRSLLGR